MAPVPIQMPVLAVADARAGNRRQADALARALGGDGPGCVLDPHAPWSWLAPRWLPGARHGFGSGFSHQLAAPPAVAIGCGRQAALATRLLRRAGSRVVQVLDPRIDPRHWDLVVAPEHDALRGTNVITLLGSLNPVDDAWLAHARVTSGDPGPSTLLLLGGPTASVPVGLETVRAAIDALHDGEAPLHVCGSARTPPDWRDALRRLANTDRVRLWFDGGDGANPYAGWLAGATRIVCTPDSVNMLSEACATRAEVDVITPEVAQGRIRRFIDALRERGRIRGFGGSSPIDPTPLRETARVAAEVRARLGL